MLNDIQQELEAREKHVLNDIACLSVNGIRRKFEQQQGYRQEFAVDSDRILHSKSYTRYIDKTQVFYMVANDHITHRVLHVQLVSKVARTIGRFLGLNEDLIEAIALGHDLGHPPFGHDGESILSAICVEHGLPAFLHNLQSVRFLECLEKRGAGLNLTLQTLDGILCHDGEIHNRSLSPATDKTFAKFDEKLRIKAEEPQTHLTPMTYEGCVVRFSDTIAYIGRDIEDAITLGLIDRDSIPKECINILGRTNGTIVYRLVTDLIENSYQKDSICFSPDISNALKQLKDFNYQNIYLNPKIKNGVGKISDCYLVLFETYLNHLTKGDDNSKIVKDFVNYIDPYHLEQSTPAAIVRDFIAGMTDDYFLKQARQLGCTLPEFYEN